MKRTLAQRKDIEGGFTLIETIVALVLMGLVLSSLATLTAEWLPNWNRGLDRVQRSEAIGIALQRIADDLAAAEFMPSGPGSRTPLFAGTELSVMFVRTALGPNTGPGLDVVRIGETGEQREFMTVRSRAGFKPLREGESLSEQLHLRDPVVLLRMPYRLSFAYAEEDLNWKAAWQNAEKLPAVVRVTVRDAASERELSLSTVVRLHVQFAADCARSGNDKCGTKTGAAQQATFDTRNTGDTRTISGSGSAAEAAARAQELRAQQYD